MGTELLSVGLDVGTTTTQLILSSLTVKNCAGSFSVPQFEITGRQIRYRSPVYFTPLKGTDLVDGDAIAQLVEEEYRRAGIGKADVDTGAIIITGETSRKENAASVLQALSGFAGDFVAATAGPDLESVLAAKGAGAVALSKELKNPVLHMDIGGGTTNLALIQDGSILRTGCLNVGGRLLRHSDGCVTYVSPVLQPFTSLRVEDTVTDSQLSELGGLLASVLEMAAGRTPVTQLLTQFATKEASSPWFPPAEHVTVSFSGGVADCIAQVQENNAFGDLGPALGAAIKNSLLCRSDYHLGKDAIRATVIGAGSHSATLSGSTVFADGISLPLKNLPAVVFDVSVCTDLTAQIRQKITAADTRQAVLVFKGFPSMDYAFLCSLSEKIAEAKLDCHLICTGADIAKALGQRLRLCRPNTPCLCIDGIELTENSYLDIGKPVGSAFPVVIKTLILGTI